MLYPLGALCLAVHVHRRCPALMPVALRWYALAFVIRCLFACLTVEYSYHVLPGQGGFCSNDSVVQSLRSRYYVALLLGRDYHMAQSGAISGDWNWHGWLSMLAGVVWWAPHFTMIPALLTIVVGGYSTVMVMLLMTAASCFWTVQVYVYLHRFSRPTTAWRVTLWMVLGAEFLYQTVVIHKELPTGIVLMYCLEIGAEGLSIRPSGQWRTILWLTLFSGAFRPAIGVFVVAAAGYYWVRERLGSQRAQDKLDALGLAGWLCFWTVSGSLRADFGGLTDFYPLALVGNFFLNPLLVWILSPYLELDFMRMASIPLMLVWPMVSALLMIGAMLYRRGQIRIPQTGLTMVCGFIIATTHAGRLTQNGFRFRMAVLPLLLAFASEAMEATKAEPVKIRRSLTVYAVLHAAGVVALNVAVYVLKGGARGH